MSSVKHSKSAKQRLETLLIECGFISPKLNLFQASRFPQSMFFTLLKLFW